jgi:5-methylcytosine-specific restriction endonuclease McrA
MPSDKFYNSAVWKRLRMSKLRANPLCESCAPSKIRAAQTVDHIIAINNGGSPTEWGNLQSLCFSCHSTKTNYIEKQGKDRIPIKGCDVSGRPLDPKHFWNR